MSRIPRGAGFALLAALVCGACSAPQEPPARTSPNVILVLVDTLRADHLGSYGYPRDTSPEIDRFAEQAVLFERARSQSACTYPSVNSLLTSRFPTVFYAQGPGQMGIPDDVPSLAELLQDAGFATIAVSASPIVRATPSKHNPNAGFGRGFEVFDESPLWREAAMVNRQALQHIDAAQKPFFLYLHYMDPHDPYVTPKQHEAQFTTEYDGPDFIANGNPNPIGEMLYDDGPELGLGEQDLQHLVDLYDEEISYFDREFGRLLVRLDARGLLDSSWIILSADHGEEFLEHGDIKHCRNLFDTQTRTPLIIRPPGGTTGSRVRSAVQNLDVVPTILDLLELDIPGLTLDGASLRHQIATGAEPPRIVFSDQGKWRSADDGRHKLILDGLSFEYSLFDLAADPREHKDIFDPESAAARDLGRALRQWLATPQGGIGTSEAIAAAEARERELKALGYLQ